MGADRAGRWQFAVVLVACVLFFAACLSSSSTDQAAADPGAPLGAEPVADEAATVLVVTTDTIRCRLIREVHGFVRGEWNSDHFGPDLPALIPSLKQAASEMGANAVVGTRIAYSTVASTFKNWHGGYAYGTAVTVHPGPAVPPPTC